MSHALRYILPLLAAVALTVGLIVHSGITFSEFRHAISGFSVASVLGVLACTAVFLLLSSVKWRMVMRRVGAESPRLDGWAPYIYYTSLGAALSIFMTVHVSVAVTRALGAKLHLKQSPIVGAGASVYEQMFDLGVLVLFVLSTSFALLFGLDPLGWAIASASAVVLAGAGGWMLVGRSRRVLLGSSRLLSRYFQRFKPAADFFAKDQSRALFEPAFVIRVFGLSVLRYLTLMLRAFLVLQAARLPIAGSDFLNAFPLVQASQIVAITPGGLGISEWTWSGVLTWSGYLASIAVQFALVNRVVNSVSLLACFICVATVSAMRGHDRRVAA